MSIKPVKPAETPAEVRPDHFPQPNTIPGGWDLSGLMSVYNPASLVNFEMKRGNPPELVAASQSIPVDLGVSAELTEKYTL
jgi:hypothetical protein